MDVLGMEKGRVRGTTKARFGVQIHKLDSEDSVLSILQRAYLRGQLNPACLAEKGALLVSLIQVPDDYSYFLAGL